MSTKLITSTLDTDAAEMFVSSITDIPHYLVVSKHTSFIPDDQDIPTPIETQQTFVTNVYNDMLFGKALVSADASSMIPRYDWESGTAYSMYMGNDPDILTKAFYVSVDTGLFVNVYKCLNNNAGANSTVEPSGQDAQPFVTPSDGYTWKYMFSVPSAIMSKFSTSAFLPVVANTSVQASATPGSIDVITVGDSGAGYDNYFTGVFRAQDISVGGDSTHFVLTETASSLNGFYQNCIIKMTSGVANNEYRKVTSYTISSGQKNIIIDSGFSVSPGPTDSYEIYPIVNVVGDGRETTACDARAIIDPNAANSVSSVEILNPGRGYRTAIASITPHAVVPVSRAAELNPILPPPGGHGSNPFIELGAKYACISARFSGDEANNIPVANDYRQVSLLRDPQFANVSVAIDFSTITGVFAPGETVATYKPLLLAGTVTTADGSTSITGSGTKFADALDPGDVVLIGDGTNQNLSTVAFVSNNTSVTLTSPTSYANTTATVSIIKTSANAVLNNASTSTLLLDSCSAAFANSSLGIIGLTSSATVQLDQNTSPNITINGADVNSFRFFTQLVKAVGTLNSGTFQVDEQVYQTTSNYTAMLFDAQPDHLWLSNESGTYDPNGELLGLSSGAIFSPTNKYQGALKVDSGEMLYLENITPITRASNKSELFKIIFEF